MVCRPIRRRNRAGISPASLFALHGVGNHVPCSDHNNGMDEYTGCDYLCWMRTDKASSGLLFLIAYVATVTAGVASSIFSAYLPLIVTDLTGQSDTATIGQVGSTAGAAFLLGWAVGAVFLGAVADRIGRKRAFTLSVAITSLGIIATALVPNVLALVVVRFITGGGAGSVLLLAAVTIAESWSTLGRARVIGILVNAFPVGLIVSGLIGSVVDDWRTAYLLGGLSVVLAVAAWMWLKEAPVYAHSETYHRDRHLAREQVLDAAYRRDLIVGVVLFGSMLVGLWAVFVWMPTWVGSLSGDGDAQWYRAMTSIALGVGNVIGGFGVGPLSDRLGRRGSAMVGYIGCMITTLVIFLPDHLPDTLVGLAVVLGAFIGLNQGTLMGYVPELFPTLIRGAASAICFNVGRIATAAGVIAGGFLITLFGGYHYAILGFGLAYAIGFVTLLLARETRGQDLPV